MITMPQENIVEIKGGRYRYHYDPDTKVTVYDGPVGDSPEIGEQEFLNGIRSEMYGVSSVGYASKLARIKDDRQHMDSNDYPSNIVLPDMWDNDLNPDRDAISTAIKKGLVEKNKLGDDVEIIVSRIDDSWREVEEQVEDAETGYIKGIFHVRHRDEMLARGKFETSTFGFPSGDHNMTWLGYEIVTIETPHFS